MDYLWNSQNTIIKLANTPAQSIHSFSDALEHNEAQGNPHDGIAHREELPAHRAGRRVSVAWNGGSSWVVYRCVRIL